MITKGNDEMTTFNITKSISVDCENLIQDIIHEVVYDYEVINGIEIEEDMQEYIDQLIRIETGKYEFDCGQYRYSIEIE